MRVNTPEEETGGGGVLDCKKKKKEMSFQHCIGLNGQNVEDICCCFISFKHSTGALMLSADCEDSGFMSEATLCAEGKQRLPASSV